MKNKIILHHPKLIKKIIREAVKFSDNNGLTVHVSKFSMSRDWRGRPKYSSITMERCHVFVEERNGILYLKVSEMSATSASFSSALIDFVYAIIDVDEQKSNFKISIFNSFGERIVSLMNFSISEVYEFEHSKNNTIKSSELDKFLKELNSPPEEQTKEVDKEQA